MVSRQLFTLVKTPSYLTPFQPFNGYRASRRFGLDRERSTALDIIAGLATNELHSLQELSMKFLCTGMTVLI